MNGKIINLALANGTGIMPGIFKSSLGYAELEDIFKQERTHLTFMVIACAALDGLTNLGKYMVQVNKIEDKKIYCELVDSTSEEKKLYKPLLPKYDDTAILTLTLFDNEERLGSFLFEYPNNIGPELGPETSLQEQTKTVPLEEILEWKVSTVIEMYRKEHTDKRSKITCTRLSGACKVMEVKTLRDLLSKNTYELMSSYRFGKKTIDTLRDILECISEEHDLTPPLTLEMLVD